MTRIEEAKELKKQGLKPNEIAKKMGIKRNTVYCYLYSPWSGESKYKKRKREEKIRGMIRTELTAFKLPLEWEDEIFRMFCSYLEVRKCPGRLFIIDVRSIMHLLCRRYKISTPRELVEATYQGRGARKQVSGYMDVLQILDGVVPAKPMDYIKKFVDAEKLPKEEIEEAEDLLKKIPFMYLQSRNPRVLAATILYVMHRAGNPTNKRILTQDYLARYFKISEVSIRNSWGQFFRNK